MHDDKIQQCKNALNELDYIARAYPIGRDPCYNFRESLRRDIDNFLEWTPSDQAPRVALILKACTQRLELARIDYCNGDHKLVREPELQEELCKNFIFLYSQIKNLHTQEANDLLSKIDVYHKQAKSLDKLLKFRSSLPQLNDEDAGNLEQKTSATGCFNLTYFTYHKSALRRVRAATMTDPEQHIQTLCKKLLGPCLSMYQFTLMHPINTALAIRPPLTPHIVY